MAPKTDSQSISVRLTLSYALTTALALALLGASMYLLLEYQFSRDDNRSMDDTVYLLETILVSRDDILGILNRDLPQDLQAFHFNRYQMRLENDRGEILYSSAGFPAVPAERLGALPVYPEERPGAGTYWTGGDGRTYLLIAAHARLGKSHQVPATVFVAVDTTLKVETLVFYRTWLVVVWLLGVLMSTLASFAIARRGLKPLRAMCGLIEAIRFPGFPQRRRMLEDSWPAELTVLATAFDAMLDELEQGMERLSRFCGDIAHEFRTPMTNMALQAEVLLQHPRTVSEYQAALASSLEEVERLSHLIERLLLLARIEQPEAGLERQQLEVGPLLERIVELFGFSAEEANISLRLSGEGTVNADPRLFEMAVTNLLSNALKYTPSGGRVWIDVQPGEHTTRIEVGDTGPGIAPEHVPRLFDRFYRADPSRSQDGKGYGLGLSLVHSIMVLHKGRVTVETQLGRGTRMRLEFPNQEGRS